MLALPPAAGFGWLVPVATAVRDGRYPTQSIPWVPGLELDLDFRLTTPSWLLGLLVTRVGALVLIYCRWYFREDDPTLWRFAAVFTAFAGAMFGSRADRQLPRALRLRCSQTRNPGSDLLSHVSIAGRTGGIVSIR